MQQQPMPQPVGMAGQQQMTGAYQPAPGMTQNAIGSPGGASASNSPMMQPPAGAQLPAQQPGAQRPGAGQPGRSRRRGHCLR